MSRNSKTARYGVYYISNGKWTGPYSGISYTLRGWSRQPLRTTLAELQNNILKSRLELRQVA